jgi:L-gulonate 5-dehydrogenase/2-deoxy-scyllo-inosamine dehydrogenase
VIESLYVAICGTDVEVINGFSDRARPPVILGHEWVGRVVAIGPGVEGDMLGKVVVGENVIRCGGCRACAVGDPCGCADSREVGFDLTGALASHFEMPARNLHPLPARLESPSACLFEPLAVCVRAVASARPGGPDDVLVIGDGVIGLMAARLAILKGARTVAVVGNHDDRLSVGSRLGVSHVLRRHEFESNSASPPVDDWTVVVEASGDPRGITLALRVAARGARVVLAGDYGHEAIPVAATEIMRKELRVLGSVASCGSWDEAVSLVVAGAVDLGAIPISVRSIDDWRGALEGARSRASLRVVLRHHAAELAR